MSFVCSRERFVSTLTLFNLSSRDSSPPLALNRTLLTMKSSMSETATDVDRKNSASAKRRRESKDNKNSMETSIANPQDPIEVSRESLFETTYLTHTTYPQCPKCELSLIHI